MSEGFLPPPPSQWKEYRDGSPPSNPSRERLIKDLQLVTQDLHVRNEKAEREIGVARHRRELAEAKLDALRSELSSVYMQLRAVTADRDALIERERQRQSK